MTSSLPVPECSVERRLKDTKETTKRDATSKGASGSTAIPPCVGCEECTFTHNNPRSRMNHHHHHPLPEFFPGRTRVVTPKDPTGHIQPFRPTRSVDVRLSSPPRRPSTPPPARRPRPPRRRSIQPASRPGPRGTRAPAPPPRCRRLSRPRRRPRRIPRGDQSLSG